jgi:hypothetical protein
MIFFQTGTNYIGTPTGYVGLEPGENIEAIETLTKCKTIEVSEADLDTSQLYKVLTGDSTFSVCLVPGFPGQTPGGDLICCVSLGDSFFNGDFIEIGDDKNRVPSRWMNPETYYRVWGPDWDRSVPWYQRAWDCREQGISI